MTRVFWLAGCLAAAPSLAVGAQAIYPVYYDCSYPASGTESATRLYVGNPNDTGVRYTIGADSNSGRSTTSSTPAQLIGSGCRP